MGLGIMVLSDEKRKERLSLHWKPIYVTLKHQCGGASGFLGAPILIAWAFIMGTRC